MLVIRLFRTGKKNQPSFKIVVTDKKNAPRGGRFVEEVGFWNPVTKEKNIRQDRIKYWLSVGAKASDTVHNLLVKEKILEKKKIPLHKVKKGQGAKPSEATVPELKAEAKPEAGIKPEPRPETNPESEAKPLT